MKIINIHGYRGSCHNAAYTALSALGYQPVSMQTDHDITPPEQVFSSLCDLIENNRPELVTGTSLGGFYAALLSVRYDLPAVLVNPCLMPFYHLPILGYKGDIAPFIRMFAELSKLDSSKIHCIIGGKDEVVTTHSFTRRLIGEDRIKVIPDGMHSGATLPLTEYFSDIMQE